MSDVVDLKTEVAPSPGLLIDKAMDGMTAAFWRVALKAATIAGGFLAKEVVARLPGGTGNLAGSFLPAKMVQGGDEIKAASLSNLPYARVQDEGGTIIPRTAKNLAIPQTPTAKSMWPREWGRDQLHFIANPMEGGVLVDSSGTTQYILRPRVTIDGVHYVDAARARIEDEAPSIVARELAKAARKETKPAGGR